MTYSANDEEAREAGGGADEETGRHDGEKEETGGDSAGQGRRDQDARQGKAAVTSRVGTQCRARTPRSRRSIR